MANIPAYPAQALHADHEYHVHPWDEPYSFTEWRDSGISHWIGRCRQCKQAVRVSVRQQIQLIWEHQSRGYHTSKRVYHHTAITAGASYYTQRGRDAFVLMTCPHGCVQTYGNGHTEPAQFTCKRIEGVHNDGIRCNAKCINATGPHCECSCAGDNHGAGHAM